VGVAKTGTTYLQRVLFAHRDALRRAGLLYPGTQPADQFLASVDLRGPDDAKFEHMDTDGAWGRIVDEVVSFDGDAVISHETLARSSARHIERIADSFADFDLRVVLTVRDLGRQIPAVWQEGLKNKSTTTFDEFLDDVFVNRDERSHRYFWKPQDIARLVRRWARQFGAEAITVVTVPPSGSPRDELWRRFAQAINLPEVPISLPGAPANSSLGPAESELLRCLNASLPSDFPWPRYIRVVKRQFAESALASRDGGRLVVPARWHGAVNERATEMIGYLERSGVAVVGELADLTPDLPIDDAAGTPADLGRDDILRVSAEVVRDLLLEPPTRRPGRSVGALLPRHQLRDRVQSVRERVRGRRGGAD
jgi:hypothetical protein